MLIKRVEKKMYVLPKSSFDVIYTQQNIRILLDIVSETKIYEELPRKTFETKSILSVKHWAVFYTFFHNSFTVCLHWMKEKQKLLHFFLYLDKEKAENVITKRVFRSKASFSCFNNLCFVCIEVFCTKTPTKNILEI